MKPNPIAKEDISLKLGSGQGLKDKIRGKYWHIYYHDIRVGKIYIDFIENDVLGKHPSIDIFINKPYQGRRIGQSAYQLACEESGLPEVYMHTKKSNLASIRAAAAAGFQELKHPEFRQVVMIWEKSI